MERQAVAMIQIEKSHDLVMEELVVLGAPVEEMVQPTKEDKVKEVVAEEVVEAEIVK